MESDWMGRYRPLVAALVRHANIVMAATSRKKGIGGGFELNALEWQVFEAIVEHRNETTSMIAISSAVGVPQSTFSKTTKKLCELGLAEKYQAVNNRKNIILRPTERALELYKSNSQRLQRDVFDAFFDKLAGVGDDELNAVIDAIQTLSDAIAPQEKPEEPQLLRKKE